MSTKVYNIRSDLELTVHEMIQSTASVMRQLICVERCFTQQALMFIHLSAFCVQNEDPSSQWLGKSQGLSEPKSLPGVADKNGICNRLNGMIIDIVNC